MPCQSRLGLALFTERGTLIEGGDSTFNMTLRERDIIFVPATLLAKLGYFLDDLLFPVKMVLQAVLQLEIVPVDHRYLQKNQFPQYLVLNAYT